MTSGRTTVRHTGKNICTKRMVQKSSTMTTGVGVRVISTIPQNLTTGKVPSTYMTMVSGRNTATKTMAREQSLLPNRRVAVMSHCTVVPWWSYSCPWPFYSLWLTVLNDDLVPFPCNSELFCCFLFIMPILGLHHPQLLLQFAIVSWREWDDIH